MSAPICPATKARSPCSPGPSASSRAGGTVPISRAITSSPAPPRSRCSGSTASAAKSAPGTCMASLPDFPGYLPAYAELHCLSNFTFLRGASHPEELVERARDLGYEALAITDECSVAGVVRAHVAARHCGLKLIVGTELRLDDGLKLVMLAADREGYGHLCTLVTRGRRRGAKGTYRLARSDLEQNLDGCLALLVPPDPPDAAQ